MSDKTSSTVPFTTPEDFNEKTDFLCKNAFEEYLKFKEFFVKNFKQNGLDSFSPTVAVFSYLSNFIGIVTCREVKDKDDLYCAMAEMLQYPMSVASNLFIVATDVGITSPDHRVNINYSDALNVAFVTSDHCLVLTMPYSYDSENNVTFHEDEGYISQVAKAVESETASGQLIELFFVFSHGSSTGGFTPEEILRYFDANGFIYDIINPKYVEDKSGVAIPFSPR